MAPFYGVQCQEDTCQAVIDRGRPRVAEGVPRQGVGRISFVSNLGLRRRPGPGSPAWAGFQAMASWAAHLIRLGSVVLGPIGEGGGGVDLHSPPSCTYRAAITPHYADVRLGRYSTRSAYAARGPRASPTSCGRCATRLCASPRPLSTGCLRGDSVLTLQHGASRFGWLNTTDATVDVHARPP
jgi:hypothetical protein